MRKVTREIALYNFNELTEQQQQYLIQDTLEWFYNNQDYMSTTIKNLKERIQKVEERTEKMQTPWFFIGYMYDEFREEVMDILNNDEYLDDGSVA